MTTTRYAGLALLLLVIAAIFTVRFHRGWLDRLCGLSPTTPDVPGDDDREASGADEQFPDDLRALRNAPVDPALISDTEMDLAWGLIWHGFEAALQDEVDRIFSPVLDELQRPRSFEELWELVNA